MQARVRLGVMDMLHHHHSPPKAGPSSFMFADLLVATCYAQASDLPATACRRATDVAKLINPLSLT